MTRLVVNLDELGTFVAHLGGFADHLADLRTEVERAARRAGVEWTGDAAALEGARQAEWTSASDRAQEALGALRSVVATARSNYAAALAANRAMWSP